MRLEPSSSRTVGCHIRAKKQNRALGPEISVKLTGELEWSTNFSLYSSLARENFAGTAVRSGGLTRRSETIGLQLPSLTG
jgi:hypothetical protein